MSKVKEIKLLRGGVASYAAQATAPIDAEIGQKGHLWMETNQVLNRMRSLAPISVAGMGTRRYYDTFPIAFDNFH